MPSARPGGGRPAASPPSARRLQHGAHALVLQVRSRNSTGIDAERARDRVHVHLARVVVRGRGQPAIRALAQRRVRRMERDALVRDVVRRADRRAARVPVVELPGDQPPVGVDAGLDVDHARRPEVARTRTPRRASTPASRACPPPSRAAPPRSHARPCACRRRPSRCRARSRARDPRACGTPSPARARTPNGRCVPVHTVSLPSVHSATAARGSSGTCAM